MCWEFQANAVQTNQCMPVGLSNYKLQNLHLYQTLWRVQPSKYSGDANHCLFLIILLKLAKAFKLRRLFCVAPSRSKSRHVFQLAFLKQTNRRWFLIQSQGSLHVCSIRLRRLPSPGARCSLSACPSSPRGAQPGSSRCRSS